MDDVDIQATPPSQDYVDQFCSSILCQFSNSTTQCNLDICSIITAISQGPKDQNLSLDPIANFCSTCASLDRLLSSSPKPSNHELDAAITILFLAFDKVSPSILKKKYDLLSELLTRVLQVGSAGDNGIVLALKCVTRLLLLRVNIMWANIAQLYYVLLDYMTDDRLKIRKQAQSCLREVLSKYLVYPDLAPLLAPASEAVVNVLERSVSVGGRSNTKSSEKPQVELNVLYVLDALKYVLPYMSAKSSDNILKYFKFLLEKREPPVTRLVTDGLHALCHQSFGQVSAEVLVDLFCSLITLLSANESSAESMTFTARMLDSGMRRVYSLNRQICEVKLPAVFSALKDIFISEHEEAILAAMAAFKSLVHACIDESLIKRGVDEITKDYNVTSREFCPTVIEKVCAITESLLDYRYALVWDASFQIVSSMFEKLGIYSSVLLGGTLKNLAELQKLPDEDFPFRKQLHECVGAAIGAMGPETFLNLLPLKLESHDLLEANHWVFPVLKQYIVGANLSFFTKEILPTISLMKQKLAMIDQQQGRNSMAIAGIINSLWSLLPSFCNYPVDIAESFKDLGKALCSALREEHQVHGIICSSLQVLIHQNKKYLEGKVDCLNVELSIPEQRTVALYASHVADHNLQVLGSCASELLSTLFNVYMRSSKDTAGLLQDTIGDLASISDKVVVTRFFRRTISKFCKVTQEAAKSRTSRYPNQMQVDKSSSEGSVTTRARLLILAASVLRGLDAEEIDDLLFVIPHALKDTEGLIQKNAYKVLSMIFKYSDESISRRLKDVLRLMEEVLPLCHFSAKRHRLDCLYFLIVHVYRDGYEQRKHEIATTFLPEIILALKEPNKKTRSRAYEILLEIGHACGDEEKGGKMENLNQFFNTVAIGQAGGTPSMISAAATGLAHLAYEFPDLVPALYDILPSTFLLLQGRNREIIKAHLGLLKVLVLKSPAEGLQKHLQDIVKGILKLQDCNKNRFKAKVKSLLIMLVRKCGVDAVNQVMPAGCTKIITNIRKLEEQKERWQLAKSVGTTSIRSKATTSSRWNHRQTVSDYGTGKWENADDRNMDAKSSFGLHNKDSSELQSKGSTLRYRRAHGTAKSLQEGLFDPLDDEPLDLLDQKKMKFALRSSELVKQNSDSIDEPDIDSEGRLIICEEGCENKGGGTHKRRTLSQLDEVKSNLRKAQKRRKISVAGWGYTGNEYGSKNAGGDVMRKDKLDPYAYWPLDRKMMSRRPAHRAAARKGIASIVKLTKKLEGRSVSKAPSMNAVTLKKKDKL